MSLLLPGFITSENSDTAPHPPPRNLCASAVHERFEAVGALRGLGWQDGPRWTQSPTEQEGSRWSVTQASSDQKKGVEGAGSLEWGRGGGREKKQNEKE